MKLRIHENSLRLRLEETELARLVETGSLEETLRFDTADDACLTYSLEIDDGTAQVRAELAGTRIRILLNPEEARKLVGGDEETVESVRDLGDDRSLRVFVERDLLS